jgi:glutamate synthase domain-containing protein 2
VLDPRIATSREATRESPALRVADETPIPESHPEATHDYVGACLELIAPDANLPPAHPAKLVVERAIPKIAAQSWSKGRTKPQTRRAGRAKRFLADTGLATHRSVARKAYRPALESGRALMEHVGAIARKYVIAHEPDDFNRRWAALEKLYAEGQFTGSFGHLVGEGTPEVMSRLIADRMLVEHYDRQIKHIGRDLVLPDGTLIEVKKLELSMMLGVSGMSFPQLSAPSILSLLYAHVRQAKDGVRSMLNTGEGGPGFHLAMLEGDEEALRNEVIYWGIKTGELTEGSIDHARVEAHVHALMKDRDHLFKDLSKEDIAKAQIVAQFGTALNGIRGEDNRIDFAKLERIGKNPHVAMIEFKVRQAAKLGSLVSMDKMDAIAAAEREVAAGKGFKSPDVSPEMKSYEDIATLVTATKIATKKPVSLKFAVGEVESIYDFLEHLAKHGALPDHIQIDGGGKELSPGSGNAPPTGSAGNTSLGAREAMMAVDAILKHLGVRDQVHIDVAGEVMMPTDAVEVMALGADSVMGARTWMAMGLGCAKVGDCKSGNCPYGIASKSGSVFAYSLDPTIVGPKAYEAAHGWRKDMLTSMMETGAVDWRSFRKTHGLHARQTTIRIREGGTQLPLQDFYGREKANRLLRDVLSMEEFEDAIYTYRPREYEAFEYLDAARRLVQYLDGVASPDPSKADAVAAFREKRLAALQGFLTVPRTGPEIRDFIRRDIPASIQQEGLHTLKSETTGPRHPQLRVLKT